jgi:hypothetical protein
MAGHLLGVLEPSVVLQVNRDASRPPGVTSNEGENCAEFTAPACCIVWPTTRAAMTAKAARAKQSQRNIFALSSCFSQRFSGSTSRTTSTLRSGSFPGSLFSASA